MKVLDIVDVTKGVKCDACMKMKGAKVKPIDGLSCGDVIARTIQEEYERFHHDKKEIIKKEQPVKQVTKQKKSTCPECGDELAHEGGCVICKNCGFSKCD